METDEPKRGIRKFLLKRMLFIPLGIVALAATSYARQHPDWAEHVYAQGVYPALSSVVGFPPSLVSFSTAEWVAALFLLFCAGYVVCCVCKLVVSKGERGMSPTVPSWGRRPSSVWCISCSPLCAG